MQAHIIGDQIHQLDLDPSLLHMDKVSRLISTCTNLMDGGKIRFIKQFIIDTSNCLISGLYRIPLFRDYGYLRDISIKNKVEIHFGKIRVRDLFGMSL